MKSIDEKVVQLKSIATKLEMEDISLDESVKLFDEGVLLAKDCYKSLNEVKGKVTVLKKELEEYKEQNFS